MNKILAWILVAGLAIFGIYYTFFRVASVGVEVTETAPDGTEKKIPFSEFAKNGGSYKCDVHQAMSDFENSGTVYMSGGKMRGEFSSVEEGRSIDTSFIYKDGLMYTWSSTMPSLGFKMKANPTASNAEAAASGTYSWNTSEIGDYDCVVWDTDSSKFELPASITFREIIGK